MIDYLIYLLKVSGSFTILYIVYRFLFRNLTFHGINRILLLVIMPLSYILPFVNLGFVSTIPVSNTDLSLIFNEFGDAGQNSVQGKFLGYTPLNFGNILFLLYGLVVICCWVKLIYSVFRLVSIKQQAAKVTDGKFSIYATNIPVIFSVFRWIFVPKNNKATINPVVVNHEKLHGIAGHTIDLLVTELYIILQWFNPFVYFFRKDLKTVHEYQVDRTILQGQIKKSDYLQLMLNNLEHTYKIIGFCNYFNGLTIKKRVLMITKNKSSKRQLVRYILLVPVVALLTVSFTMAQNEVGDVPCISPIKKGEYIKISSGYGMRVHPKLKVEKFHQGVDFSAKTGTPIRATASGTVTKVEFLEKTYGKIVISRSLRTQI